MWRTVNVTWCFCSTSCFRSYHRLLLSGLCVCQACQFCQLLLLLLFAFVSFHFSFSKTAIFRNILFMCIGGWIYSLDSKPSKPKKKDKWKGRPEPLTALYFLFLKCERILFQGLSEQTNIDIEYVVYILFTFAGFLCFLPLCLGSCLTRFLDILVSFTSC